MCAADTSTASSSTTSSSSSSSLEADRDALVELYNSLGGDNWDDNTGWTGDGNLSDWYGVTADSDGVTALDLSGNNLVGKRDKAVEGTGVGVFLCEVLGMVYVA